MAEQKKPKQLMEDPLIFLKVQGDTSQYVLSKESTGKVKQSIKKPGIEMIDAVTRLIYYLEKGS